MVFIKYFKKYELIGERIQLKYFPIIYATSKNILTTILFS